MDHSLKGRFKIANFANIHTSLASQFYKVIKNITKTVKNKMEYFNPFPQGLFM